MKKYAPSNGTEGEFFMSAFCYKCRKWTDDPDGVTQCRIWQNAMIYDIDDPKYPKQWRYKQGNPVCTAFVDRQKHNAMRRAKKKRVIATGRRNLSLF